MARPLLVIAGWMLLISVALPQGYPPEQAVARMATEPGFEARLIASEPLVRQPLSVTFDGKGRMWVIQYLQYPNPAGLKAVSQDQYLRTVWDKVPEPPPRGPKGADRITILEDPDATGRYQKAKDFVGGLNLATGLALGHGGAFVMQSPYLLFYPDRNGDDIPDSDPEVLLAGFGMEDSHAHRQQPRLGARRLALRGPGEHVILRRHPAGRRPAGHRPREPYRRHGLAVSP